MSSLTNFKDLFASRHNSEEIPALFVGHGSPMNAIEENEFSAEWVRLGHSLPQPKAILCISAHWQTKGTYVTAMEKPQTIHDFGGFPKALFDMQYPAPGAPELARETKSLIQKTAVGLDNDWGLDHGTWSVLARMFPKADIPTYQLSLDYSVSPEYHYSLAQELSALRRKGVLIIGSGNIVHNLRMVSFENPGGFDWAIEFDEKVKAAIESRNDSAIVSYEKFGASARLAVPTNEHYLPLLYALGSAGNAKKLTFFNDKNIAGSISMRSMIIE